MHEWPRFGQGEESGGLDLTQESDQITVAVRVEQKRPLAARPHNFVMPPRDIEAHHLQSG
jgi:hypothetical protein